MQFKKKTIYVLKIIFKQVAEMWLKAENIQ